MTAPPLLTAVTKCAGCPTDLVGDGATSLTDLSILPTNFGIAGGATRAIGDISGDGAVDLPDLSRLGAAFRTGC